MFLHKISENIYILPIWSLTVINQIVNNVKNRIKTTPPYESHFSYLTKKRHIQTQARQDKAWQGMARQGQARPDEARRGGAQTRRCPLVLKNTVGANLRKSRNRRNFEKGYTFVCICLFSSGFSYITPRTSIWILKNRMYAEKCLIQLISLSQKGYFHDDVIKWKHFPRNWPFVRGIHQSRWIPLTKASDAELWCFSLIYVWINGWVNNREAGDLRRYRVHCDVSVMLSYVVKIKSHFAWKRGVLLELKSAISVKKGCFSRPESGVGFVGCGVCGVNTLRPRQNGRHFADDIFKGIFLNESVWIRIKFSLKFVSKGPTNDIPAFLQIMAWRRTGDEPLYEPMLVSLLAHICVTRPQWVKRTLNDENT